MDVLKVIDDVVQINLFRAHLFYYFMEKELMLKHFPLPIRWHIFTLLSFYLMKRQ